MIEKRSLSFNVLLFVLRLCTYNSSVVRHARTQTLGNSRTHKHKHTNTRTCVSSNLLTPNNKCCVSYIYLYVYGYSWAHYTRTNKSIEYIDCVWYSQTVNVCFIFNTYKLAPLFVLTLNVCLCVCTV